MCLRLPPGTRTVIDFYQREMMSVIDGLDYVEVFLDYTGVLGKGDFDEHVNELDEVLSRMEDDRLKLNLAKCKWTVKEAKYLGFIAK